MAHLLGDPISTIRNLLRKLSKCQERAKHFKGLDSGPLLIDQIRLVGETRPEVDPDGAGGEEPPQTDSEEGSGSSAAKVAEQAFFKRLKQDRWWKALGILTESYDEWGKGDEAMKMLFVPHTPHMDATDRTQAMAYYSRHEKQTKTISCSCRS